MSPVKLFSVFVLDVFLLNFNLHNYILIVHEFNGLKIKHWPYVNS